MKMICFILITLLFQSCKTINVLEFNNYNYYYFKIDKINPPEGFIYHDKKNSFFKIRKARYNYDRSYTKKQFNLVLKKDTMRILCPFIDDSNFYIKNLFFKKGTYYLDISKDLEKINGSNMKAPKQLNSMVFEKYYNLNHTYLPDCKEIQRKDLLFKDLLFHVIDFKDTKSVNLIPMSVERFWDYKFWPKINKE